MTYASFVGFAFAGVVAWIVVAMVWGVIGPFFTQDPKPKPIYRSAVPALDYETLYGVRTYDEVARTLWPDVRHDIEMSTR